jgi:hypothetical protein
MSASKTCFKLLSDIFMRKTKTFEDFLTGMSMFRETIAVVHSSVMFRHCVESASCCKIT